MTDAEHWEVKPENIIRVSDEEYDWLLAWLEEPVTDLPKLRELLQRPTVFTQEDD